MKLISILLLVLVILSIGVVARNVLTPTSLLQHSNINLSNYYNKTEVDTLISDVEAGNGSFLKLDQTFPQTIINGIPLFEETRVIDNPHQLVDKFYVDSAVTSLGARYYMMDTASGIADYKLTQITPSAGIEASDIHNEVINNQYLRGWISPMAGQPDKLITGVYNWVVFAQQSGGTGKKDLRLYWELVERKADTTEVVIATSSNSNLISNTKTKHSIFIALSEDYVIANDSYVIGKIYASVSGSGGDPSVTLFYEGDSDSHWEIPTNLEILSDHFVPYTGANTNVYLGANSLTATSVIETTPTLYKLDQSTPQNIDFGSGTGLTYDVKDLSDGMAPAGWLDFPRMKFSNSNTQGFPQDAGLINELLVIQHDGDQPTLAFIGNEVITKGIAAIQYDAVGNAFGLNLDIQDTNLDENSRVIQLSQDGTLFIGGGKFTTILNTNTGLKESIEAVGSYIGSSTAGSRTAFKFTDRVANGIGGQERTTAYIAGKLNKATVATFEGGMELGVFNKDNINLPIIAMSVDGYGDVTIPKKLYVTDHVVFNGRFTAGTDAFYVDKGSGNVGIGTLPDIPTSRLEVVENFAGSGGVLVKNKNTENTAATIVRLDGSDDTTHFIVGSNPTTRNINPGWNFISAINEGLKFFVGDTFMTQNEVLRLENDALNIYVNTTIDGDLTVDGSITISGGVIYDNGTDYIWDFR